MDKRQLAAYAYHNCEFEHAFALASSRSGCAVSAALEIKALSELDQKADAMEAADLACARYPDQGELHYLRGMAYYLGGQPRPRIEEAFLAAAELDHPSAAMGLAFLAFAAKRGEEATQLLERASPGEFELEHVRRLMLFQVLSTLGRGAEAEAHLREADRILSRMPSLLRHYWGQLCWVRHYRATEAFEAAGALVDRLLGQLDERLMPRLHRNATEARRMIGLRSASPNIIVPDARADARAGAMAAINRKPMLNSLFAFLKDKGRTGATKEDLAAQVWGEDYNPLIHDDRIYKAVSRLRRILGDDQAAPRYLTQSGRAYVLTLPDDDAPAPSGGGE